MIAPENPPGFVVRTEAQKAAWDNGYRIERGIEGCQQCKLGLVHRFRSSIICRVIPGRGPKGREPGMPRRLLDSGFAATRPSLRRLRKLACVGAPE